MKIKLILSVHISAKQKQSRRAFFFVSFRYSSFTRCYTNTLGLYVTFSYFVQQNGNNAAIPVVFAAVIVVWASVGNHTECSRDYQH